MIHAHELCDDSTAVRTVRASDRFYCRSIGQIPPTLPFKVPLAESGRLPGYRRSLKKWPVYNASGLPLLVSDAAALLRWAHFDRSFHPIRPPDQRSALKNQSPESKPDRTSDTAQVSKSSEGLPVDEIMTPEIAQEEALRGDFVIRWAVILLAVLLGWTHITSTTTLVQLRTGQMLRANGILPPRNDTFFTHTMAMEPWVNPSWLGDLFLSCLYDLGGATALTIWNVLLAGLCFWLISRISRPGVSTWWGSLCALAALIACFPLLTPGPSSMTVLGLALVLTLLQRTIESPHGNSLWYFSPILFLWSNFDERAYYGVAIVLLFAIGRLLQPAAPGCRKRLLAATVSAVVASCVHPFPGSVFTAPMQFHNSFLPAMNAYGGSLSQEFPHLWLQVFDVAAWTGNGPYLWAAAVLLGLTVIACFLNFRKLDLGLLLVALGINAIGLLSGSDFTAVAIVNSVIATLFVQAWYVSAVRQTYSINPGELFFSRGGRAVTVLGLFAVAYLAISGWMTGPDGRRIGVGFSPQLQADIEGYDELIGAASTGAFDDHPFHLTPRQGDLLIWTGRRSFSDSRLALFANGDPSILETQRNLIERLLSPAEELPIAELKEWERARDLKLRQYGLVQIIVPLETPMDYTYWNDLMEQQLIAEGGPVRLWRQVALAGPAVRLFRLDGIGETERTYLAKLRSSSTIDNTFMTPTVGEAVNRSMFPGAPTFYEQSLLLPKPTASNEIRVAEHYLQRLTRARLSPAEATAYCYQAIRHARRGLNGDHNNFAGYRNLATAYANLYFLEKGLVENDPQTLLVERRYFQAIAALRHALIRMPDDLNLQFLMFQLFAQSNQNDLALDCLERIKVLTGERDGDDGSYTVIPPRLPVMPVHDRR